MSIQSSIGGSVNQCSFSILSCGCCNFCVCDNPVLVSGDEFNYAIGSAKLDLLSSSYSNEKIKNKNLKIKIQKRKNVEESVGTHGNGSFVVVNNEDRVLPRIVKCGDLDLIDYRDHERDLV